MFHVLIGSSSHVTVHQDDPTWSMILPGQRYRKLITFMITDSQMFTLPPYLAIQMKSFVYRVLKSLVFRNILH